MVRPNGSYTQQGQVKFSTPILLSPGQVAFPINVPSLIFIPDTVIVNNQTAATVQVGPSQGGPFQTIRQYSYQPISWQYAPSLYVQQLGSAVIQANDFFEVDVRSSPFGSPSASSYAPVFSSPAGWGSLDASNVLTRRAAGDPFNVRDVNQFYDLLVGTMTGQPVVLDRENGAYMLQFRRQAATAHTYGLAIDTNGNFLLDDVTLSARLLTIDHASGAATFAFALLAGSLQAGSTAPPASGVGSQGGYAMPNLTALSAADTGGTQRALLFLDAANNLQLRKGSAAAQFEFVNFAGTAVVVAVTDTGRITAPAVGASAKTLLNYVPITPTLTTVNNPANNSNLSVNLSGVSASAVAVAVAALYQSGAANGTDNVQIQDVSNNLVAAGQAAAPNSEPNASGIVPSSGATIHYLVSSTGTRVSPLISFWAAGYYEPT